MVNCSYLRGPGKNVLQSPMLTFILANSADPDEILQIVTVHVGLHCLPKYSFRVLLYTNVFISKSCILLSNKSMDMHWHIRCIIGL